MLRRRLVGLLSDHGGLAGRQEAFRLLWDAAPEKDADNDLLIDLLLDDASGIPLPDGRGPVELAFDLHEEAKSRDLLVRYAEAELPRPDNASAELLQRERALLQERREARNRAGAGVIRLMSASDARIAETDRELNAIWDALQPVAPGYVRVRRGQPARLADVREFLRHEPARPSLVSYFCSLQRVHTFVVTPDGEVRALSASLRQELIEDVSRQLRRTFDGDDDVFPPLAPLNGRRPWRRALDFLDPVSQLVRFLEHVDRAAPVLVSLDRPLNGLPIHALRPENDDRYVAEIAGLWYIPNSSFFSTLNITSRAATRRAFVGAVPTAVDDPAAFDDAAVLTEAGWTVSTLPSTKLTPGVALDMMRQEHIVHLTCHGWVNPREPMETGLVLSSDMSLPPTELAELPTPLRLPYLLTIRQLAAEELSVSLLTLRACSTARTADGSDPDEADSLVSALLTTGVRTIVAGMWDVDRDSSRRLVVDFYRGYQGPLWTAFRDAQRAMLSDDGPYQHPYHWAALAPFGDWR